MQPDQPDPTAHLQAMLDDARTYCLARFSYPPEVYVSLEAREQHIDNDARATTREPDFAMPWNAGYARGLAAAERRFASAIAEQFGHTVEGISTTSGAVAVPISESLLKVALRTTREQGRRQATEGLAREWGVELSDEDEGRVWPADSEADAREYVVRVPSHRVVSRLVGPWETAEQPDEDPPLERPSAADIASALAVVDAPYRPDVKVEYLDEDEPATGGVVDSAPVPKWRRDDFCGREHTYRDSCVYALSKPEDGGR